MGFERTCLEEEMEAAAMAEEAQTAAIFFFFLPKDYLPISLCCV
jgi:hypothetical protein